MENIEILITAYLVIGVLIAMGADQLRKNDIAQGKQKNPLNAASFIFIIIIWFLIFIPLFLKFVYDTFRGKK